MSLFSGAVTASYYPAQQLPAQYQQTDALKKLSVTSQGREKDKEKVTNDSAGNLFALSG